MARPRYPRPVNWSLVLDMVGAVGLCFLLPWLVVVWFAL
jgi:hypothetical protein